MVSGICKARSRQPVRAWPDYVLGWKNKKGTDIRYQLLPLAHTCTYKVDSWREYMRIYNDRN